MKKIEMNCNQCPYTDIECYEQCKSDHFTIDDFSLYEKVQADKEAWNNFLEMLKILGEENEN